jgi:hypothetical protein
MKIGEIIKDSLRYPFSDWKKFLIFGILVMISNIDFSLSKFNNSFIYLLAILGTVFLLGYIFKSIKFSLDDLAEHPESNNWIQIFVDGIKVLAVFIVYIILPGFLFLVFIIGSGVPVTLAFSLSLLYPFIFAPIYLISITHMANNDNKISFAFKIFEIIEKIESIGWINLIIWYIITVAIFLIIKFIVGTISGFINDIVGIIISVILTSILYMYLSRSIALVYKSGYKNQ